MKNLIETPKETHLNFYLKEEPICIKIVKSGWSIPQLYHVIVEWGDYMQTDNHIMDAAQIMEKYDIDVTVSF